MTLKLISAEEIIFTGEVEAVTLPGVLGSFTVLDHHASLISVLTKGKIDYRGLEGEASVDIKGGLVDVDNNIVSVCIY